MTELERAAMAYANALREHWEAQASDMQTWKDKAYEMVCSTHGTLYRAAQLAAQDAA